MQEEPLKSDGEREGNYTPCDTIQLSTVEFDLMHTDIWLLQMALEKLGYTVKKKKDTLTFESDGFDFIAGKFEDGKVEVTFDARKKFDVNSVKRAYSSEVVRYAARKAGWQVKHTDLRKFEVSKRF